MKGGGWHLSRADSAGFERWLAHDAHAHGLAIFQKNDPPNAAADVGIFDGMIIEECNYYRDPCSGPGGDATRYLNAGKPVLNAEYTEDGETAAKFCSADVAAGITGALFNVDLDGKTYIPCAPRGRSAEGETPTALIPRSAATSSTAGCCTGPRLPITQAMGSAAENPGRVVLLGGLTAGAVCLGLVWPLHATAVGARAGIETAISLLALVSALLLASRFRRTRRIDDLLLAGVVATAGLAELAFATLPAVAGLNSWAGETAPRPEWRRRSPWLSRASPWPRPRGDPLATPADDQARRAGACRPPGHRPAWRRCC